MQNISREVKSLTKRIAVHSILKIVNSMKQRQSFLVKNGQNRVDLEEDEQDN